MSPTSVRQPGRSKAGLWLTGAVIAVTLAGIAVDRFLLFRRSPPAALPAQAAKQPAVPAPATAVVFNPPPRSIAVLPFVNMSGDKDQEYFSEGLTEELLNSLARINELQVAARTSSFSFKGEHPDIATVARKLNVGAVLEGSVRRSAHTVRVTAQLVNGVTGFDVWSQTYDRDLGDVLKLQTDIAGGVARSLKLALLGDIATKIELGGTRSGAALDAYLHAEKGYADRSNGRDVEVAIANYTKAIQLDPNYAIAYAGRSRAFAYLAMDYASGPVISISVDKAEADARKAIALAPDLGIAYSALGGVFEDALDFGRASAEYDRAITLEPGNARILTDYGNFAVCMGDAEAGLSALRRALTLDPLNTGAQSNLGLGLILTRSYQEALEVLERAHKLYPQDSVIAINVGISQYLLGDYQDALKSCEEQADSSFKHLCLAMTLDKLGRRTDAEASLKKISASEGDASILYTWIFAQWGQTNRALDSLETAMRVRSPYLEQLKTAELFDPIRKEPRFQAIERALEFPR